MRKLITLILLCSTGLIYGQEKSSYTRIYTNILQNVDISHPYANIGIEKDFKGNQCLALGFGVYYRNLMYSDKTDGVNLSLEYKRFRSEIFYYAFGLKGGSLKYNTSSEFLLEELDSTYMESYSINKIVGDLHLKVGFRQNIGSHFYFDYFAGLGLRYKDTEHQNRNRPDDVFYRRTIRLLDIRDREGHFFYPILKLGVVIGLKL